MMYDVIQDEPSDNFKRAWQAAARHLGSLGGDGFNWLRANLNPPMAEHLSFRLGNQIFFVFVEAAEFQYEKANDLFSQVTQEANAVPCLMPMTERLTSYEPSANGWGLIHAEIRESVNPPDLVSSDLIEMTDWELHDFAVQVVKSQLSEEGKNVFSTQSSRKIDPSIWYEHEGDTYWVIVREARYPNNQPAMPPHVADIANELSKIGKAGFFASIVVANHNDSFDPNTKTPGSFLPLYRGHAMSVKYEGLVSIT